MGRSLQQALDRRHPEGGLRRPRQEGFSKRNGLRGPAPLRCPARMPGVMKIPTAALRRIARRHRLDAIVLFGSRARGTARHDSDVDLCVVGDRSADAGLKLQWELAEAFGRDADLVRFETADPLLRFHSVYHGRLLWGSRRTFERLRLRALKEWQDARKIGDAVAAFLDRPR